MNYKNQILREEDVFKLINLVPKSWYRSENALKLFLEDLVSTGEELHNILKLYPKVLCEPLDNYYTIFRLMGNTNENLIFQLLYSYDKTIPYAAFLAIFSPNKAYKNYFVNTRDELINHHYNWIVELAIAEINGVLWQVSPEISSLLYRFRQQIKEINLPQNTLRKSLTNEELEIRAAINSDIKKVYKEKGTDTALALIKKLNIK